MNQAHEVAETDQYQWLEDVTGQAALDWVRERNAETLAELSGTARFQDLRAGAREVLDAEDRIPFVRRRGGYLYNFWQDAAQPKGLWRRTTLAEYRRAQPGRNAIRPRNRAIPLQRRSATLETRAIGWLRSPRAPASFPLAQNRRPRSSDKT